jgi:hypothetical protein
LRGLQRWQGGWRAGVVWLSAQWPRAMPHQSTPGFCFWRDGSWMVIRGSAAVRAGGRRAGVDGSAMPGCFRIWSTPLNHSRKPGFATWPPSKSRPRLGYRSSREHEQCPAWGRRKKDAAARVMAPGSHAPAGGKPKAIYRHPGTGGHPVEAHSGPRLASSARGVTQRHTTTRPARPGGSQVAGGRGVGPPETASTPVRSVW